MNVAMSASLWTRRLLLAASLAGAGLLWATLPRAANGVADQLDSQAPEGRAVKAAERGRQEESADERLRTVLKQWEEAEAAARDRHLIFRVTETDKIFQTTTIRSGESFCKKPDLLRLEMRDQKGEQIYLLVISGRDRELRWFDFGMKRVFRVPWPPPAPTKSASSGWWIFSWEFFLEAISSCSWPYRGMNVGQLMQDFSIELKQDEYYNYLLMKPKVQSNGSWRWPNYFKQLRIALNNKTHLVRQIWALGQNYNEQLWDFERVETNVTPPISEKTITQNLPQGWSEALYPAGESPKPPANLDPAKK